MITDEGENSSPRFVPALKEYRDKMKADPNVVIVRTPGGGRGLERECNDNGIAVDVSQFSGDSYSLPNLVPLLTRPSKLDLLIEIMAYPLPKRLPV